MNAILLLLCTAQLKFTHPVSIGFERAHNGIFFRVTVNDHRDPLWFVLDSGAAHTLLDAKVAERLGIRATEQSTIGGAGSGRVPVAIAKNDTLSIDGLSISGLDFNLLDLSMLTDTWGRPLDGIIGYDLFCDSIVTIDYAAQRLTIQPASALIAIPRGASVLPLTIRKGWSFVDATIKVAGNAAVTDQFLIDTGSQDAADHPIIRKSTGALRKIQSGNGIGNPTPGVVGPTEWFRLGRFTLGSMSSSCCGNDATSRLLGAEVLSRFRITFDYPHAQMIVSQ